MESNSTVFEPGSAVEVSIDGDGINGSWFSGNIISCMDSNRFLVQYHNLQERVVVDLHQLRPLPPPENQPEFKCGDTVEAFRNNRWWEGHVTEDLQNGSFLVSFKDYEEMTLPRELLRTPREWMNHNWLLSNRDRISELPDHVLHRMMDCMETKEAVKTCVLSKRWPHLCKELTSLIYYTDSDMEKISPIARFKKFASWVLSNRDVSCSLRNLTVTDNWTDRELLDKVVEHALVCNVQHLSLNLFWDLESLPLVFCCSSLTSLELRKDGLPCVAKLPKSLQLPVLKSLCLKRFEFTRSGNDSVEPFSNCFVLNTLVLERCSLPVDAQVLRISNSTLSSLTISVVQEGQFVLSTPNICSFTFSGNVGHQLLSTCNFPFLREVCIDVDLDLGPDQNEHILVIMKWLQVLANVKILEFDARAFQIIRYALPYFILSGSQPPSFVRLESWRVNKHLLSSISHEEVDTLVKYLIKNSPMDRIDIISV